ncbi:hypothetical protein LMH87_009286 [Akanthomyces muscarius]|uniref:Uncharacterized protein n=1 Tax=Akanthomyces muscarius TaxID=2231603 RepID=A0A9W8QDL8_AKAMU|nr:hypothetical protein LMH87_009286 [Akanthomyces muscarius]KAJ4152766.1 hypothetical protein LMH87_009286 [Akanthomyces muscarius]
MTRLPDDNRVDTTTLFKAKFRKGDYHTLNLYYMREKPNYSVYTFPRMAAAVNRNTYRFLLDGCIIGSNTTPGSSDYSSDDYRSEFTPGQIDRIKSI